MDEQLENRGNRKLINPVVADELFKSVRERKEYRSLSESDLARLIGIHPDTLTSILTTSGPFNSRTMQRFAAFVGALPEHRLYIENKAQTQKAHTHEIREPQKDTYVYSINNKASRMPVATPNESGDTSTFLEAIRAEVQESVRRELALKCTGTGPHQRIGTSHRIFVGRAKEILAFRNLLTRESPTATLIFGVGGVGKTAFVAEVVNPLSEAKQYNAVLCNTPYDSSGKTRSRLDPSRKWHNLLREIGCQVGQSFGHSATAEQLESKVLNALSRREELLLVIDEYERLSTEHRERLPKLIKLHAPNVRLVAVCRRYVRNFDTYMHVLPQSLTDGWGIFLESYKNTQRNFISDEPSENSESPIDSIEQQYWLEVHLGGESCIPLIAVLLGSLLGMRGWLPSDLSNEQGILEILEKFREDGQTDDVVDTIVSKILVEISQPARILFYWITSLAYAEIPVGLLSNILNIDEDSIAGQLAMLASCSLTILRRHGRGASSSWIAAHRHIYTIGRSIAGSNSRRMALAERRAAVVKNLTSLEEQSFTESLARLEHLAAFEIFVSEENSVVLEMSPAETDIFYYCQACLGAVLLSCRKYKEAETVWRSVALYRRNSIGLEKRETIKAYGNQFEAIGNQGDVDRAVIEIDGLLQELSPGYYRDFLCYAKVMIYLNSSNTKQALEEAKILYKKLFKRDLGNREIASRCLVAISHCFASLGERQRAFRISLRVYTKFRSLLTGEEEWDVAYVLARMATFMDKREIAKNAIRSALDICNKLTVMRSQRLIQSTNTFCEIFLMDGDLVECRVVLKALTKSIALDQPNLAVVSARDYWSLAKRFVHCGFVSQGISIMRAIIDHDFRSKGPADVQSLIHLAGLAEVERDEGVMDGALRGLEMLYKKSVSEFGEERLETEELGFMIANILRYTDRKVFARDAYFKAIVRHKNRISDERYIFSRVLPFANIIRDLGELSESERLLRHVCSIVEKTPEYAAHRRFTYSSMALTLIARGKLNEGRRFFRDSGATENVSKLNLELVYQLALAERALGQVDRARELLRSAYDRGQGDNKPSGRVWVEILCEFASVLMMEEDSSYCNKIMAECRSYKFSDQATMLKSDIIGKTIKFRSKIDIESLKEIELVAKFSEERFGGSLLISLIAWNAYIVAGIELLQRSPQARNTMLLASREYLIELWERFQNGPFRENAAQMVRLWRNLNELLILLDLHPIAASPVFYETEDYCPLDCSRWQI